MTVRARLVVGLALLGTLLLLLAHARVYAFVTDDAYISFRYAQHLADGGGLVFNAGERVEGYTNFLWVMLLAGFARLGFAPETMATPLSLLATVGLWAVVAAYASRSLRPGDHRLWIAVPCLLLAVTRSVAVWSTSGLETRLFELLIVAGVLSTAHRLTVERGREPPLLLPALLFALATLTRPDGLLITASCALVASVVLVSRRSLGRRTVWAALLYVGIVGAHLAFRHAYYGEWLPNTWFAKVSGQDWSGYGLQYALAFVTEYLAVLWVLPLLVAVWAHLRGGTWFVPALIAAAVLPHALYIVRVGGDHFEYRPFDLYFPLLFLLIGDGLRVSWDGGGGRRVVGSAYAALLVAGLIAIPWQSHREFPGPYSPGYPGSGQHPRDEFVSAPGNPMARLPGVSRLQDSYQDVLWSMTSHFVGLRQEEHAHFVETVKPEGILLAGYVVSGLLPADTHLAMDSVGAIPYLSGLRVLDRNGLTDHDVARTSARRQLMAHAKGATRDYARAAGVDFWAPGPVHLIYSPDDKSLRGRLDTCRDRERDCYLAALDPQHLLFAELLQGRAATAARFPRLTFVSADDRPGLYELGVPW